MKVNLNELELPDRLPRTSPKWARCPVCTEYFEWKIRLCPKCKVLMLAVYTGDWIPHKLRNS